MIAIDRVSYLDTEPDGNGDTNYFYRNKYLIRNNQETIVVLESNFILSDYFRIGKAVIKLLGKEVL